MSSETNIQSIISAASIRHIICLFVCFIHTVFTLIEVWQTDHKSGHVYDLDTIVKQISCEYTNHIRKSWTNHNVTSGMHSECILSSKQHTLISPDSETLKQMLSSLEEISYTSAFGKWSMQEIYWQWGCTEWVYKMKEMEWPVHISSWWQVSRRIWQRCPTHSGESQNVF